MTAIQLQTGLTELLIFKLVYLVAFGAIGSMIILAFRFEDDYHNAIYGVLGTLAMLCFLFSWGGENWGWPLPGLVWLIGVVFLAFMLGLGLGWLLPIDADEYVRRPPRSDS